MVEYYSALKRKGIRTPATMWMDPDTELSEISYTQKDKYDSTYMKYLE